jgi:hypothetical protein
MSFPSEFPRPALGTLLHAKDAGIPALALAGYDILGYGLYLAFGDVKYLAGFDFETVTTLAEAADQSEKIQKRYDQLKGSGVGMAMIILQLLQEFGPVILAFIKKIREKRSARS